MLRFPFNGRPMQSRTSPQEQREDLQEEKQAPDEQAAEPGLSPELNFLMSMTMKDGMADNKMFDMMEDILPLVSGKDRESIQNILEARHAGLNNTSSQHKPPQRSNNSSLSDYSRQSSQQELLSVMQRYAGQDSSDMMNQMQRSVQMQNDFENMSKRMGKLGNMQNASMEDMMEMMTMFMPNQDMSEFKNMQNVMNMMKMMGGNNNLKPEDMMRFMNMNKQQ